MTLSLQYLDAPPHLTEQTEKIAYKMSVASKSTITRPSIIWCGGLNSNLDGGKAIYLHNWARQKGFSFIRFDYFGHGQSSGLFGEGTISRWGEDVVTVIDELTPGDVILVGSSMGGWSSLLATRARLNRVKGLFLINPAPDFTEKLMWANWTTEVRDMIMSDGVYFEPSEYDEPYEYRKALIEDGRAHQLLDGPFVFDGPVHIFQGGQDNVVPPEYSRRLVDVITSDDIECTLVKAADHSLSRPQDLVLLSQSLEALCRKLTR